MADDLASLQRDLQTALVNFEGMKIEALSQQGLDIGRIHVDPAKNRNALHELVLNYIAYSVAERPPKLHIKFIDILAVLKKHGLDVNEKDIKGMTALHHVATSPNHPEIVRALITEGSRVNLPDAGQQTALHKAVLTGSSDDVAALLEGGADPNLMDNMGHSSIHVAVKRRNNNLILKLLGGCGGTIDLNHPESSKSSICPTPLHTAARLGRVENGRALLELGADYNKKNGAGQTALHIAAGHEISGELCAALLKKICEDSRTGHASRIDAVDTFHGETPLHKAVAAGIARNVYELVRHGADRNLPDSTGNTALHKAASLCQDMSIWRQLTRKTKEKNDVIALSSLNFTVTNNDGLTPYDRAVESKNYVAQIVLRAKLSEHES